MIWETAATYGEAKEALKSFSDSCQAKATRINKGHFTDIDGMWAAPISPGVVAMLHILHPKHLGAGRSYRNLRTALGLDDE
jgi:hypothetical protein